jgi:hypothetical protein
VLENQAHQRPCRGSGQGLEVLHRDAGFPLAAFAVDDIQHEYSRLKRLGVVFRSEPTKMGPTTADAICYRVVESRAASANGRSA